MKKIISLIFLVISIFWIVTLFKEPYEKNKSLNVTGAFQRKLDIKYLDKIYEFNGLTKWTLSDFSSRDGETIKGID